MVVPQSQILPIKPYHKLCGQSLTLDFFLISINLKYEKLMFYIAKEYLLFSLSNYELKFVGLIFAFYVLTEMYFLWNCNVKKMIFYFVMYCCWLSRFVNIADLFSTQVNGCTWHLTVISICLLCFSFFHLTRDFPLSRILLFYRFLTEYL